MAIEDRILDDLVQAIHQPKRLNRAILVDGQPIHAWQYDALSLPETGEYALLREYTATRGGGIGYVAAATLTHGRGDWACYVGYSEATAYPDIAREIVATGAKVDREIAHLLFPEIALWWWRR